MRRNWWLLLASTLVCAAAAYAYSQSQTKVYESHVQLFLSSQTQSTDSWTIYQGGLFTADRVHSYVDLVSSPTVTRPVIDELHLPYTTGDLEGAISASAQEGTVLMDVTVQDDSAHLAQRIAAATATSFIGAVDRLERPQDGSPSPVRLSVSRPASYSATPVSPKTAFDTALAAFLGLLIGAVGAVLKNRQDTRFVDLELLSGLDLPVLGIVPGDRSSGATHSLRLSDYDAARGEALRQLRTSLRYVDPDAPPKAIVVASAVAGEGKSTTSLGLAGALAESGARVILLEGDLRRPSLARYLEHTGPGVGLSGVLVGLAGCDDALVDMSGDAAGSLRVLLAGPIPPNPGQLIASHRMAGVVAELAADCDYLVIDAPALLPVSDARVLATLADGVLLVCRTGISREADVREALELLDSVRARVLGFVANGIKRRRSAYEYEAERGPRRRGQEPVAVAPDGGDAA